MYAPEGYLPFSTVLDTSSDIAELHFRPSVLDLATVTDGKVTIDPNSEEFKIIRTEESLLAAWLLTKVMQQLGTYMCSPSGAILKCAALMSFHEDLLVWYDWPRVVSDHNELRLLTGLSEALDSPEQVSRIYNPLVRFRFIEVVTGTIAVSSREETLKSFFSDAAEDPEPQTSVARQFDGWAICFKENDFGGDVYHNILSVFHDNMEFKQSEFDTPAKRTGRPRKVDRAASYYVKLFPHGHGQLTWEMATQKVVEVTGEAISAQSLAREINQRSGLQG